MKTLKSCFTKVTNELQLVMYLTQLFMKNASKVAVWLNYVGALEKIRGFLNASSSDKIVFVRGATKAINLIAQTFGKAIISEGNEIVISCHEHHAIIVPWQMLCVVNGAKLRVIPVDESGQVILSEYENILSPKTCILCTYLQCVRNHNTCSRNGQYSP